MRKQREPGGMRYWVVVDIRYRGIGCMMYMYLLYVALQNENKLLETNLGSWGGIDCKMHTST